MTAGFPDPPPPLRAGEVIGRSTLFRHERRSEVEPPRLWTGRRCRLCNQVSEGSPQGRAMGQNSHIKKHVRLGDVEQCWQPGKKPGTWDAAVYTGRGDVAYRVTAQGAEKSAALEVPA